MRPLQMLTLLTALSAPTVVGLTPATAHAADQCKTMADMGSKVWGETPKLVKDAIAASGPFGASAIKAIRLVDEGIKIWNKLANDKSWAKVGPRRMDFGEWNEGTLIGPTERMFVSGIPAVNPVVVDFKKLDFDGKVDVVVCKVPEKGKAKLVKSFTVEAGAKKGLVKSVNIDDAKGYVITVALHGKSVAKKLNYEVRAKFEYEEEQAEQSRTVSGARR